MKKNLVGVAMPTSTGDKKGVAGSGSGLMDPAHVSNVVTCCLHRINNYIIIIVPTITSSLCVYTLVHVYTGPCVHWSNNDM